MDSSANAGSSSTEQLSPKKEPRWDPQQNHGRQGAADYPGCDQIVLSHPTLHAGSDCPDCAEHHTKARLYALKDPGHLLVLEGQPIITGTHYEIEKLRCTLCGKQYAAPVPEELKNRPKYDETCRSSLAINHYYLGYPFKRIELLQAMHGIPVPDATQWDQMQKLYEVVAPVHAALEQAAANGERFFYDDTTHRILLKDLPPHRKGIYTTAIAAQVDKEHRAYLFYTSWHYAGENIKTLFEARESESSFLTMTDASANNIPRTIPEDLLVQWIFCFCLVHGRRKFYELYDIFEGEVRFVLDQIGLVYANGRYCHQQHYDAEQRLLHNQKYSAPVMELLKTWLTNQLVFYQVEPNNPLGEAIRYMLKYWIPLTQFLRIPGAAIDNSLAERMVKVVIRYRKNSLFFRTAEGAAVGDVLMSLIHTARCNQENPFDYLNTLQRYSDAVAENPGQWLPWNYQSRLAAFDIKRVA